MYHKIKDFVRIFRLIKVIGWKKRISLGDESGSNYKYTNLRSIEEVVGRIRPRLNDIPERRRGIATSVKEKRDRERDESIQLECVSINRILIYIYLYPGGGLARFSKSADDLINESLSELLIEPTSGGVR